MLFRSMEQDLKDIRDRLMGKPKRPEAENASINFSGKNGLLPEEADKPLGFSVVDQSDTNKEELLETIAPEVVARQDEVEHVKEDSRNSDSVPIVSEIPEPVTSDITGPNISENSDSTIPEIDNKIPKRSKIKTFGLLFLILLIFVAGVYFIYDGYIQKKEKDQDILSNELVNQNAEVKDEATPEEELIPESEYVIDNTAEIQAQKTNDAVRLERVSGFANTLIQYSLETNTAFPVSAKYVKLSETNAVSDLLRKALVRSKQDESLLLDPKNPEFYFAYRSLDGKEFEFTARMEIVADHDCAQEDFDKSGVCVYRYIMNEEMIDSVRNILK